MTQPGLLVLGLLAGLAAEVHAFGAEDAPVKRIDRAKVVGPPVLDASAEAGFYVWLEDGWYQVAAVTTLPVGTKKRLTKTYRIAVTSTKEISPKLGNFKKDGGGEKDLKLSVVVGANGERAQFKTDGNITVSSAMDGDKAVPIFVGPLSKRAASSVKIGRF